MKQNTKLDTGMMDEAVEAFHTCVTINPTYPDAWCYYHDALRDAGYPRGNEEDDEFHHVVLRALETQPDSVLLATFKDQCHHCGKINPGTTQDRSGDSGGNGDVTPSSFMKCARCEVARYCGKVLILKTS